MRYSLRYIALLLFCFSITAVAAPQFEHVLYKGDGKLIGWEARSALNRYLSVRFGTHERIILHKQTDGFLHNSARLNNSASSILFDWHILGGRFRTTMGVFISSYDLHLSSVPDIDFQFDDIVVDIDTAEISSVVDQAESESVNYAEQSFTVDILGVTEQVTIPAGSLELDIDTDSIPEQMVIRDLRAQIDMQDINASSDVKFNPVSPYLGFGWGNKPYSNSPIRYSIDVGVIYVYEPEVSLEAHGKINDIHPLLTAELENYLAEEEQQLQRKYNDGGLLPFVSVGVSVVF